MFNYGMEAARIDPHLLTPYATARLANGAAWRIAYRQVVILPPGNTIRQRLVLSGLPTSTLWWDASGIRNARQHWYWQPEYDGQTAPWLETIHRSWPYHPPLWLLDAEAVVLDASAFSADKRQRLHEQRSLLRFWAQRRAPLVYLAQDGRDAWHVERLTQGPTLSR